MDRVSQAKKGTRRFDFLMDFEVGFEGCLLGGRIQGGGLGPELMMFFFFQKKS